MSLPGPNQYYLRTAGPVNLRSRCVACALFGSLIYISVAWLHHAVTSFERSRVVDLELQDSHHDDECRATQETLELCMVCSLQLWVERKKMKLDKHARYNERNWACASFWDYFIGLIFIAGIGAIFFTNIFVNSLAQYSLFNLYCKHLR